ncbi:YheC/YheD family protein [Bacillus timonensis]|nr:YheC/YheD family protein [Bacillus timonensis]
MSLIKKIEIRTIADHLLPTPYCLKISDSLLLGLHLETSQNISLACSVKKEEVQVIPFHSNDPVVYMSETLLQTFSLPKEDFLLSIKKQNQTSIVLGPFITVITEVHDKSENVSFGSIDSFCKELAIYCESKGIYFYITSLKLMKKQVGYIYLDSKWEKVNVPLPDVVHNRIHSRKREMSSQFEEIVTLLNNYQIPYFNDHFLNKWEVFQLLQKQEHLHPYLPETELLDSKRKLEEMLYKHDSLFIKPVHGSQGKKIFRINKQPESYELDYTTFETEIERNYETFQSLFLSMKNRLNQQLFVVQQGLSLLTYKNRPLDFRFLCHKTLKNEWQVTSSIARVSSKDEFVSNLARGGELKKVKDVLLESFDKKTSVDIRKMMIELALEVAEVISLSREGTYAELGIDLALDVNGKPWIIEVNTKPSKNQDPDNLANSIRPSAKAIIQHCLYLAKFST